MSSFLNALILQDNSDGETFTVHSDFEYRLGHVDNNIIIKVPAGFKTDLGSIPKIAWWVVPKLGKYNQSAVLHDALYQRVREKKFNRAIADAIFLEAMGVVGVPFWQRWLIYLSVRIFGVFAVK